MLILILMRIPVLGLPVFFACTVSADETEEIRVLVEFDRPFSLARVGGPNMDLILKKDQHTRVTFQLVDHNRLIPRVQESLRDYPFYYQPEVELVPTIETIVISKREGIPDKGLTKLFPVLRTASGDFRVLFSNQLSVPQGQRELVIRTRDE